MNSINQVITRGYRSFDEQEEIAWQRLNLASSEKNLEEAKRTLHWLLKIKRLKTIEL